MKTYEVLEKALALIEDEKDWCGDGWGGATDRFCALRAIFTVEGEDFGRLAGSTARIAVERLARTYLGDWNDNHSHAEVVELFQKAIRQEKDKAGVLVDVPAATTSSTPSATPRFLA